LLFAAIDASQIELGFRGLSAQVECGPKHHQDEAEANTTAVHNAR